MKQILKVTYTHALFPLCFVSRMKIDIHFSLIAAAVTYIMWKSVGEDKMKKIEGKKIDDDDFKKRKGYWRVDCQSASKGKLDHFVKFIITGIKCSHTG